MPSSWISLAEELARKDKLLAPLIKRVGPPKIELQTDAFRALVESILSQQLAVRAAATITARFRALHPPFPTAPAILKMRKTKLRGAGLSGQKTSYVKSLSERWQDKVWRRGWASLSDEELIARLIEVKGIGEWTAHMFLIFSLGRPDVLPTGDFGVRKGIQLLHGLKEMPLPKEIPGLVPHWKGASSIGAWYVWRGLDSDYWKG